MTTPGEAPLVDGALVRSQTVMFKVESQQNISIERKMWANTTEACL